MDASLDRSSQKEGDRCWPDALSLGRHGFAMSVARRPVWVRTAASPSNV